MNRNELMLVTAALVITGVLKMAEMPARALAMFGHNPVVMAMALPHVPILADVPSAPEAPEMRLEPQAPSAPELAELPPMPQPLQIHIQGVNSPDQAFIDSKVERAVRKAACARQRSLSQLQRNHIVEEQVNETVRRALAQSAETWKSIPGAN